MAAKSKSKNGALLSPKQMNMAYGLGASVVILGALFKILHWELGPLNGSVLLAVGLITEALIFALAAFEPLDDGLDWSLVYPELAGGESNNQDPEGLLSKKLDTMLREANLDSKLMSDLGDSIRSFGEAAQSMSPTADALDSTKKYGEQIAHAAAQMESLNGVYQVQMDAANRQAALNEKVAENAEQLKAQMEHMANNLASLNSVYGGMLSAMNNK
ncbi:MAG: gliding motility protein GldL [Flavobacteriaceae bacterium]|jgi:gliding motility-associated protein GldL|nr:gliding motility protein GldL [Flavobacteriaceae bacterium]MDG1961658.1 gliding motility protein GldL [Flavobacteriaceae bacterium]